MLNVSQKFGPALSVPAKQNRPLLVNKEQIYIYIFVSVSSTTTTITTTTKKKDYNNKKGKENATFVYYGGWEMIERQTDRLVGW